MIKLYDTSNNALIGEINEAQLQFLIDQLEEESASDRDYYINQPTLDLFAQRGADADLLALLRGALGQRQDMKIRWQKA